MKQTMTVMLAILVSAVVSSAQDQERTPKSRMGDDGEMRQRMQDRIKARRESEGGGQSRERFAGRAGGHNRDAMMERLLDNPEMREKLGLSDEAVEKIKDKLLKLKSEAIELKGKMEKLSLEQARAMTSKELDKDKIMDLVEDLGKLRTKLAKIQIEKMLLFRENIDPEKMQEIRSKIQKRMQKRTSGENGERQDDVRGSSDRKTGDRVGEKRRKHNEDGAQEASPSLPLEPM